MKVLVACEESQEVCKAFRAAGHEAYSCDILPCSGRHPEWHFQEDVRKHLKTHCYDCIIWFIPCTDLAVSGARWFKDKQVDGRQQSSIDFFMFAVNYPCLRKAIENPIGIMSKLYRKPDQIIQPWMFGHGEVKATCLWLFNLPKLQATHVVDGRVPRVHYMSPSSDRAKLRSKTYPGVAHAMATQWGDVGHGIASNKSEQKEARR